MLKEKSKLNDKLIWKKNVFDYTHKRRRVYIGRDILSTSRVLGHRRLLEGILVTIRSKRFSKLATSFVIRRKTFGVVFFVDFPFYLIGADKFEVRRFSYSRKICCSRLTPFRFLF